MEICAVVGTPDLQADTLAVYRGDLQKAFQRLAFHGFEGVELMMKRPRLLNGKDIRRWVDDSGLKLVCLCTGQVYGEDGLGLVGEDRNVCSQAMARLKEFVDFAGEHFGRDTFVNIGRVRGMGYSGDRTRTLDEMVCVFQAIADYAWPSGIRLVLEPVTAAQTNFINTTQDGIEVVERVNRDNFALMLDVYHMNIEDDDMYESIRQAGEKCWFVHFTDDNRKYPGCGHLDFQKIVDALNLIRYRGYVSLEILPWPDSETAAEAAMRHLRRFIPKAS